MVHLSEAQVREMLSGRAGMQRAISLLEAGFQSIADGTAVNDPRRRLRAPAGATTTPGVTQNTGGAMLHVLAAADSRAGYIGLKAYASSRAGAFFYVLLFAADSGHPLAMIEADYLGQVRTGAASGLATKYMSRADADTLAIIGTGGQAFTQALAITAVRDLSAIRVFGRDAARRESFALRLNDELGKWGCVAKVRACESAKEAVSGAGIVATATTSSKPVLLGEWITPGMHINAIGGNVATKAELDAAAVNRADRIVVDSIAQSRIESGELLQSGVERTGNDRWNGIVELSDVISGKIPGRGSAGEVTLFKSNGVAIEDIALAGWLYEESKQHG